METNEPPDPAAVPETSSPETAPPAATAESAAETGAPVSSAPAIADAPAAASPPREDRPPRDDRPPREGRPPRDQRRGQPGQGRGQQGRPSGRDQRERGGGGGQAQNRQSQNRQGQSQQPQPRQPWSKPDFLARAVKDGIDKEFIDGAAEFARSVGSGISPIHLRGIFGELARQEVSGPDPTRLLLIRPRLAYLTARAGRGEMKDLRHVIERGLEPVCAEGISDEERAARLDRLCRGVEAIFAYQRMHERKGGERS